MGEIPGPPARSRSHARAARSGCAYAWRRCRSWASLALASGRGARGSGPPARADRRPQGIDAGRLAVFRIEAAAGGPDRARAGRWFYPRLIMIESCSPSPCAPGRPWATAAPAAAGGFTGSKSRLCLPPASQACRPPGTSSMSRRRDLRMPPPCPPPRAGRWPRRAPILALILAAGFVTGLVAGLVTGPAPASETPPPRPQAEVARPVDPAAAAALFAMPAVAEETRAALAGVPEGDLAAAAAALDALVARHPGVGGGLCQPRGAGDAAGRDRDRARAARGRRRRTASPAWLGSPPIRCSRRSPATPRLAALARRGPAAGAGPGQGRPGAGRCRQHRLEPRERAAGAALQLPRQDRRPGAAARRGQRRREHPGRALAPRPRRRQPRRSLRQPRPRPLAARPGGASAAQPSSTYAEAARAAELDYGLNEQPAVRPSDLRQLLDRDHRRRALAQPAALRDDPGRRHRAAPALAERRDEPALRLSGAQGLRPEERRPLPGQHPLYPGLARLLGLRQAVPRRHRADPRRLPPRHQGSGWSPRT